MGTNALKERDGEPDERKRRRGHKHRGVGKGTKKKVGERETEKKMIGKVLSLSDIRQQYRLAERDEDDSKK